MKKRLLNISPNCKLIMHSLAYKHHIKCFSFSWVAFSSLQCTYGFLSGPLMDQLYGSLVRVLCCIAQCNVSPCLLQEKGLQVGSFQSLHTLMNLNKIHEGINQHNRYVICAGIRMPWRQDPGHAPRQLMESIKCIEKAP